MVRGCPTADSGGEGALGGGSHPSVVVARVAVPHSSLVSVVVRNLLLSCLVQAKVHPTLVSTVAVVDISVFLRAGVRVFRGIPGGSDGRGRVSSQSCGLGTRYGRGRGSWST